MRHLTTLLILLAASLVAAAPAQACMMNEVYPGFWSSPPQPKKGEVVLKLKFIAWAKPGPSKLDFRPADIDDADGETEQIANPFRTSCSGGTYVFEVVEVISGEFRPAEISITLPIAGGFRKDLYIGDTVIVAGRPIGKIPLDARYTGLTRRELDQMEKRWGPIQTWDISGHDEREALIGRHPLSVSVHPGKSEVAALAYRPPLLERVLALKAFDPEYICDPLLSVYGLKCPD